MMLLKNLTSIIFFIIIAFPLKAQNSNLFINEFLASNTATILSPVYFEYSDWIEIYNNSTAILDLSGYYLTDDLLKPNKWKIPDNTLISANGYRVFWADGYDTGVHTNFKLAKEAGFIGLFRDDGTVIDSITYPVQMKDISYGRNINNLSQWTYFTKPTLLAKNNANMISGFISDPVFSLHGGFYSGKQVITLSSNDVGAEIRYTLDGTPPDENSNLYIDPIEIDSTTAVRTRAFVEGKLPGDIITNTYFINEPVYLPVISLVTDPANFFDDKIGIYVTGTNGKAGDCDPTIRNVNQDWERPVNIEFYETTGEMRLNQIAGIKIFGGCSRTRYPQKSFALFARSEYGKGSFDYQLFPDKKNYKFENFLLRSSSDDQVYTMMRDGLAHTVVAQTPNANVQAYRPAVVFINGEYWGIHNIREKVDEHYFKGNFDLEPDNINILERDPYQSYNVFYGNALTYNSMLDYMKSHNMSKDESYNYVQTQMDVDQYIDYQIGHIYLAERDWPGNNIRFWRANNGKYTKWRWINYDMDQVFTYTTENKLAIAAAVNGPYWPNPPWSTLLFRKLLLNNEFKIKFIQRYAYLMSTIYNPVQLLYIVDSIKSKIAPEITRHIKKWGGKKDPDANESWIPYTFNSYEEWEANVDSIKKFIIERQQFEIKNIIDFFNLSGTAQLSVDMNMPGAGKLKICSGVISNSGYTGKYFLDVPLTIEAAPNFGYKFLYWKSGNNIFTTPELNLSLTANYSITAYYEKETINDSSLVIINEINYNSSEDFDTGDWVELYNRQNKDVDLSGWILKDSNDDHSFNFPEGTEIKANDYLVVCSDSAAFKKWNPDVSNIIGSFSFGLNNKGEVIRLFANNNLPVDSSDYDNKYPWPTEADGSGATLELKETNLDNDLPGNWISVQGKHGTPGKRNSELTIVDAEKTTHPRGFTLYNNYPNPFNPSTVISYQLPVNCKVILKIFNSVGQEVATLVNEFQNAGFHSSLFTLSSSLPSGIYFYQLRAGSFTATKKFIVLK